MAYFTVMLGNDRLRGVAYCQVIFIYKMVITPSVTSTIYTVLYLVTSLNILSY